MDKKEITLRLTKEFNILYDLRVEQIDKKEALKKADENGEIVHHANLDNEIEILRTKIRIEELKNICKLLEIDWKEVRKKAFKEE